MNGQCIPSGWATAALGELGELRGGLTPSKANPQFWEKGTVPWISPKDMKSLVIKTSEDCVTEAALEETNLRLLPPESVLMVVRSGILARTFPVAVSEVTATINQDLKALTPPKGVKAKFLAFQLRAREREVLASCVKDGTTVTSIELSSLRSVPIQIAPTIEQERVVAKIEELLSDLDAGIAALERARANLKRYRAAVLKAAVEGKLTEQWCARQVFAIRAQKRTLSSIRE